jgi:protein arginine N-methyltransferase 1
MYSLQGYGNMIADAVRTDAYAAALRAAVRPGCVVVDIGTGPGLFAILACRFGARRVIAIESGDIIEVARRVAAANGCADRIEFVHADSRDVEIGERAEVVVSDLHGVLPYFGRHLETMKDAHLRFLAPGGAMIPAKETMIAACVEAPELHRRHVSMVGQQIRARHARGARWRKQWRRAVVQPEQLLGPPRACGTIGFSHIDSEHFGQEVPLAVERGPRRATACAACGSTPRSPPGQNQRRPGRAGPILTAAHSSRGPRAVALAAGVHRIEARLRARLTRGDYLWTWETRVLRGVRELARFRQSISSRSRSSPRRCARQSASHVPRLGEEGRVGLRPRPHVAGGRAWGHRTPTLRALSRQVSALARRPTLVGDLEAVQHVNGIARLYRSQRSIWCLACAASRLDDSSERRVLRVARGAPGLGARARLRRAARPEALLHRHLSSRAGARIPKPVMAALWGGYELGLRRNRDAARELARIVVDFTAHDIPALPYKGPVLAVTAYGDLGLREFGDLDIVVRRVDVARATALLEATGYRAEFELAPAVADAVLRSWRGYDVQLRKAPHLVELHWRTDADFPVESDEPRWWRELPRISLEGVTMPTFDPTDLLLVLCIHGGKHRWGALGWLVDIAEVLRREPSIEWGTIATRARALGVERRLYVGLALARDLLDAPLPPQIRERCARPEVAQLAQRVRAETLCPRPTPAGIVRTLHGELQLYDRVSQRLKHVARTIFAPSMAELSRWPLPRALHFLYVPLRLARLAGKHVFTLRSPQNRAAATPRTPPPQPHSTG